MEGAVENIEDSLKWAGIDYDEGPRSDQDIVGTAGGEVAIGDKKREYYGPYTQSQRKALYQSHANTLVEAGHAYRCFCTEERLLATRGRGATAGKLVHVR